MPPCGNAGSISPSSLPDHFVFSTTIHYSDMQEPPRKRRRAIVACLACRNRKSRCSGGRPQCSRCIELGLTCQYTSGAQDHEPVLMGAEYAPLQIAASDPNHALADMFSLLKTA
ncbi:hypothetical protein BJX70DRAFT_361709 [Aspergillus crustosus]